MLSRLAGAILRAVLVALLVALPAMLLPAAGGDRALMVSFTATCLGALIFAEYNAVAPSLVQFRDAPPFNRLRFGALAVILLCLSLMLRHEAAPSALSSAVVSAGLFSADLLDVPYSPVRLMILTLPEGASAADQMRLGCAAALSVCVALMMVLVFALLVRFTNWPIYRGNFNLWTNLPTFEAQHGKDLLKRLERAVTFNFAAGFLLLFFVPALLAYGLPMVHALDPQDSYAQMWIIAAWAFIPASMMMRALALVQIAALLAEQRRDCDLHGQETFVIP